jgi:hypothetical protein
MEKLTADRAACTVLDSVPRSLIVRTFRVDEDEMPEVGASATAKSREAGGPPIPSSASLRFPDVRRRCENSVRPTTQPSGAGSQVFLIYAPMEEAITQSP